MAEDRYQTLRPAPAGIRGRRLSGGIDVMPKPIGSLRWPWWLVGTLIAAAAVVVTSGPWLSDETQVPSADPGVSEPGTSPSGHPSRQGSAGRDAARDTQPRIAPQGQVLTADSLASGIGAVAFYEALMNFDPAEAIQALQTASEQAEGLYALDAVYRRIVELCADDDPRVAEGARYARRRMQALRIAHEIPEPPPADEDEQSLGQSWIRGSRELLEAAVEEFFSLEKRALVAPNPAVRLEGIEAAIRQDEERGLDLLSRAVRGDSEAGNRLTAVSELEQMLKSGLGDSDRILALLEEAAGDPDPRVAELSNLILQEQVSGAQDLAHPEEKGERKDGAGTTQPRDLPESAVEPVNSAREQLLVDSDPAVRLGGIQAAASERREDGVDLLSQAALGDWEPDNRLSAVSELEQMLKSGVGDRDQILHMLEVASVDPDPRVAELSQLIIEEQGAGRR